MNLRRTTRTTSIRPLGFKKTILQYFAFLVTTLSACLLTSAHAAQDVLPKTHSQHIHTRTLAASCAACHGTQGNSHSITPVLAGLDATYFSMQMHAFKAMSRASTVMHHHAKGLTDTEITQLSDYFSQQKRISTPAPAPQALEANHD